MSAELKPTDFPAFFEAVHGKGVTPFPWQTRLLETIVETGAWPALLDLPTGSGKTAAIDVALFHLALEAGKLAARRAPCRIAFVVDRRLVVDDAYTRAEKIAKALIDPGHETLKAVAKQLSLLAEHGRRPLIARRLRGGVPLDRDLARTPTQPTIFCSTVDQVGSRLLFRGYGVSDPMKPIAAGLLGGDCLILLDEVHLAKPFSQTLEAVGQFRKVPRDRPYAPPPWDVVTLTATPGEAGTFALDDADYADPVLSVRLSAAKQARILKPKGEHKAALVDEVRAALKTLNDQGIDNPAIALVVNRVSRARDAHKMLGGELGDEADVQLIIGPARPFDRRELYDNDERPGILAPIKTGGARDLTKPIILVATQTIEAGVDLDLDGLVTEAASLDALRQRFGRLNRAGREIAPYAAILAHKDDIKAKTDDPVYGAAARLTWERLTAWAGEDGTVDFGINAVAARLGDLSPDDLRALQSTPLNAPIMMPAYVDLWSQTYPIPAADPEVSLFLHGSRTSPEGVRIVWRADLDLGEPDEAKAILTLAPPRPDEALEISLPAARAWLRAQFKDADVADAPEGEREVKETKNGRPAFRWAGPDSERSEVIEPGRLRPGDLIVVPATYGGCDKFGWKPESKANVRDIGHELYANRRLALRLNRAVIENIFLTGPDDDFELEEDLEQPADDPFESEADKVKRRKTARAEQRLRWAKAALETLNAALANDGKIAAVLSGLSFDRSKSLKEALDRIQQAPFRRLDRDAYGRDDDEPLGLILTGRLKAIWDDGPSATAEERLPATEATDLPATEDDALGSTGGFDLTLDRHLEDVETTARAFAQAAGLPEIVASDVALAAGLHDLGKVDYRFQTFLYGGHVYEVDEGRLLAKSAKPIPRNAWEESDLPKSWRHEALSVRMARAHPRLAAANDPELVLWLIGTHHGRGRPFFPHADPAEANAADLRHVLDKALSEPLKTGPQSPTFDLDGYDWPALFVVLKRRYGAWELARLEAIIRLADHRASERRWDQPAGSLEP